MSGIEYAVSARPSGLAQVLRLLPASRACRLAAVLIVALCAIIPICSLHAQPILDGQMGVNYLDIRSGLPKNNVRDMMTDSYGFVWIATQGGGLVRYDGYQFHTVDDGDRGSKASRKMAEDSYRRLWAVYEEHTTVLSLRTLQPVTPDSRVTDLSQLLAQPAVYVLRDSLKRLWLVTRTHINLLTFDKKGNVTSLTRCEYTSNNPGVVLSDVMGNGRVWANIDGGVYALEKRGDKLVKRSISPVMQQLKGLYVPAMMRRGDKVWLATNGGLYAYGLTTGQLTAYHPDMRTASLSHEFCSALAIDSHGRLVVGTLAGVDVLADDGQTFLHWNSHSPLMPLSGDFVSCFLTLRGQLWVGTEASGIVQVVPRPLILTNYNHTASDGSLGTDVVNAMWAEPSGRLWVGTVEGGLNVMEPGQTTFRHFTTSNSALTHNSVSTLTADRKGRLWMGTWGGGVCLIDLNDPTEIVPLDVEASYRELVQYVGALAFDERNNGLWIGSNAGMYFYDMAKGRLTDPFDGNRNVRGCIGSIITRDGQLWMGCIYGVRVVDLRRRNSDGTFTVRALTCRLDNPESGVIEHISSFCQAADGTLWMGSDNYGLYRRYTDNKGQEHFEAITTKQGLPNNAVKGIVEDGTQRLWITTDHGLAVYDPKTKIFNTYGESDGLPSSEFYWNSIITQGGKIFLGTQNGLSVVDGENDLPAMKHLRFTALTIDNRLIQADGEHISEDISTAQKVTIHESEHSLAIYFSSLLYGHHEQGTYSYRLRGLSDEWTTLPPGEHGVRFSALRPGSYTLEVRYAATASAENVSTGSITIEVKPYFYRAWWFHAIVACVIIGILTLWVRRRLQRIRHDEAERQLAPIRKELEKNNNPEVFRTRIAHILNNEGKIRDSISKSVEADKKKTAKKTGKPFIERATQIMEQHYGDSDFGIDEFCSAIGMSRTLVNKHLNEEAGVPLSQFIRNYRLNMARQLLLKNKANRNITEIAFSVGFNDPKYFSRCFTRMYGVTPKAFGNGEESEEEADKPANE